MSDTLQYATSCNMQLGARVRAPTPWCACAAGHAHERRKCAGSVSHDVCSPALKHPSWPSSIHAAHAERTC
eukprot:scaffold220573_cov21-Tisochrysis_lutea.AAC.2